MEKSKFISVFLESISVMARSVSPSIVNFLVSLYIVRKAGLPLWGELAEILLMVTFFNVVTSWGNKEYATRLFSKYPDSFAQSFYQTLLYRLPLLLPVLLIAYIVSDFGIIGTELIISLACTRFLIASFEPVIIIKKKFHWALFLEMAALGLLFIGLYFIPLSIQSCIFLLVLSDLFKLVILFLFFIDKPTVLTLNVSSAAVRNYLHETFPFFALAFVGLAHSKIDQLFVNIFLQDEEKALYQIYTNLLILLMALPSFLLTTLLKSLYRSSNKTFEKISRQTFIVGSIILPVFLILLYYIIEFVYSIQLSRNMLILGYTAVLPIYYYSPLIYMLFKGKKEILVTKIIIVGALLAISFSLILIPTYRIEGGLLAMSISNWGVFLYFLLAKKIKLSPANSIPIF